MCDACKPFSYCLMLKKNVEDMKSAISIQSQPKE